MRRPARLLALSLVLVATGCSRPASELPEITIRGDAARSVEIDRWEAVRSFGVVVKWTARVTRRSGPALASIAYTLYAPSGRVLSQGTIQPGSAYDYKEPLRPGDRFTLSVPAYRGESTGSVVSRIELELSTGRPADPTSVMGLPFEEIPAGVLAADPPG